MKFLLVQEISSRNLCLSTWKTICCDIKFPTFARNFLPVTRIVFLWQEFFFLWQEFFSCDKNFFPVASNFLWQEISSFYKKSSCGQKFLSVARNFLLWQNISCWGKYMFLLTRELLPTFRVSLKISWEPGSLAPGEYPTLF